MKAALIVEVPDDFIEQRFAEVLAEHPGWESTPAAFFAERLEAIGDDELPIALWGWPVTVTVEAVPE